MNNLNNLQTNALIVDYSRRNANTNNKKEIIKEIGIICQDKTSLEQLTPNDKKNILENINKLDKNLNNRFFGGKTHTESSVKAWVLIFAKFNGGNTPKDLEELNNFITSNFTSANKYQIDNKFDWGRNKNNEYFKSIVDFCNKKLMNSHHSDRNSYNSLYTKFNISLNTTLHLSSITSLEDNMQSKENYSPKLYEALPEEKKRSDSPDEQANNEEIIPQEQVQPIINEDSSNKTKRSASVSTNCSESSEEKPNNLEYEILKNHILNESISQDKIGDFYSNQKFLLKFKNNSELLKKLTSMKGDDLFDSIKNLQFNENLRSRINENYLAAKKSLKEGKNSNKNYYMDQHALYSKDSDDLRMIMQSEQRLISEILKK